MGKYVKSETTTEILTSGFSRRFSFKEKCSTITVASSFVSLTLNGPIFVHGALLQ